MHLTVTIWQRAYKSSYLRTWHVLTTCRRLSTESFHKDETVSVKVGGNGFVDLRISKPVQPAGKNDVLICLPPGLFLGRPGRRAWIAESVAERLPTATIIDVKYRLEPLGTRAESDHRFPTPIHDVFAAFDYAVGTNSPHNHFEESGRIIYKRPQICLYGSHIGGALALSLALTKPNEIHAIAVEEPLVDWPALDEIAAHDPGKRKTAQSTDKEAQARAARVLVKMRTSLFRTPSGYFDEFASPMLFLRAPGRDTPLTKTAAALDTELDYVEGASIRYGEGEHDVGIVENSHEGFSPYDDDWHTAESTTIRNTEYRVNTDQDAATKLDSTILGTVTTSEVPSKTAPMASVQPRRRKVLRRWPPTTQPENVLLPHVKIFLNRPPRHGAALDENTNISPITRLQGTELCELLRRACFWGHEEGFAEDRIGLIESEVGSDGAQRPQENVLEWLKTRFKDTL